MFLNIYKKHKNILNIYVLLSVSSMENERIFRAGLSQSAALFQLRISQPPLPFLSPLFLSLSFLSFPLPSLPFPPFPLLFPRIKPAKRSGERCKLPRAEPRPQTHFVALYARKTHLVAVLLVLWSALQ